MDENEWKFWNEFVGAEDVHSKIEFAVLNFLDEISTSRFWYYDANQYRSTKIDLIKTGVKYSIDINAVSVLSRTLFLESFAYIDLEIIKLHSNVVYKNDIFDFGIKRSTKIHAALDKLLCLLGCDADTLMFMSNIGAGLCGDFVFRDSDGTPIQAFTSNSITNIEDESVAFNRITPEPSLIIVVETKGLGNTLSTSVFEEFPSAMIVKTTGNPNVTLRCLLRKIADAYPDVKFHAYLDLNLGGYRIFSLLQLGRMMEDSQGRSTNRIATSNKFKLGDRINHVGLHSSQIEETEEADLLEQNPALGDDDKIAEFQTEVDRLITFRAKNGYANDYESEQLELLRDNLYYVQAEHSDRRAVDLVMNHLHAQYPKDLIHQKPSSSSSAQDILVGPFWSCIKHSLPGD